MLVNDTMMPQTSVAKANAPATTIRPVNTIKRWCPLAELA
jgi:hypothetical protein